jgi:integrase
MASVQPDGKHYRVKFRVPVAGRLKDRSRTFATRREAEDYARQVERLYEARGVASAGEPTVAELVERFLAWCEVRRTGSTVHFYRAKLAYIVAAIGPVQLRRLTPEHLDAAYTHLVTAGGAAGRALHPRTVHHVHRVVHRMLAVAVKWRLAPDNVASQATPPAVPRSRAQAPSVEDARRLLAAAQRDPWAPLLVLALMSGLRRGELLGVRWADLDLDGGWVSVSQVAEQAGRTFGLRAQPKTKSSTRELGLDAGTVEVLRAWKARQAAIMLRAGIRSHPDALVFADLRTGDVTQPYQPDYVTGVARELAKQAGLPAGVAPLHGLRHRHASSLQHLPLKLVSDRLGHSSIQITADLYQHGDKASARATATAAGEALGNLIPLPGAAVEPAEPPVRIKREHVKRTRRASD